MNSVQDPELKTPVSVCRDRTLTTHCNNGSSGRDRREGAVPARRAVRPRHRRKVKRSIVRNRSSEFSWSRWPKRQKEWPTRKKEKTHSCLHRSKLRPREEGRKRRRQHKESLGWSYCPAPFALMPVLRREARRGGKRNLHENGAFVTKNNDEDLLRTRRHRRSRPFVRPP